MVKTTTGDLFGSKSQTLVNTVNCVGVMGKGVAVGFKERFPDMYREYVRLCDAHRVHLGEPYLYKKLTGPWVLNFPTKDHWRSVSKLSDIIKGLEYLKAHYREWGIESLAVPPLGCGNGGLEWRVVGPTLYRYLSDLDIPVELYAPHGTVPFELTPEFLRSGSGSTSPAPVANTLPPMVPRIQPVALALVEILRQVVAEPYHWPVGRITFQKIAYFATEAGLPTGLEFVKGSYGPYSADLKPMLSKLVNNGLIEERSLGRMLAVCPGPTFKDAKASFEFDLAEWTGIIEQVADLFMRMQTQQAEIAASVLFVVRKSSPSDVLTEYDVFQSVMDWKIRRKPPLHPEQVAQTVRSLNLLSWVKLAPSSNLPIAQEAWT
jgi:uncharacterized protein YwgA/O-acetyl-ADP-ribose deacetylase (regulator of RNase III)